MSRISKENYKRVIDKNADKYVNAEPTDLVRFKDEHFLTTNSSGIGGFPIGSGNPSQGSGIIFINNQWVYGLANASGINGIPIVGDPNHGDGIIFRNGQWVTALNSASGINNIAVVGAPSHGDVLIFRNGQWVPALADASGINGVPIIGTPSHGDGIIFRNGQWVTALNNSSGINDIPVVGVPGDGDSLIFRDNQWIPGLTDASGINDIPVIGNPSDGDSLVFHSGQWVPGLTDASGINGYAIVGSPSHGDGLIFQYGEWITALTNASGINGEAIVGSPSTNDLLTYNGTSWTSAPPGSQAQIVGGVTTDTSNALLGGWSHAGNSNYTYRRVGRHLEFFVNMGNIDSTPHSTNALRITLPSGLSYTRNSLGGSTGIAGLDTARHWVTGKVFRNTGGNTSVPLMGTINGATGTWFDIFVETIGIPESSGTLQIETPIVEFLQTNNVIDLENDSNYGINIYGMIPIGGWTETTG